MESMLAPFVERAAHSTRLATSVPVSCATVQPTASAIKIISGIFAVRSPLRMRLSVACEIPVRAAKVRWESLAALRALSIAVLRFGSMRQLNHFWIPDSILSR